VASIFGINLALPYRNASELESKLELYHRAETLGRFRNWIDLQLHNELFGIVLRHATVSAVLRTTSMRPSENRRNLFFHDSLRRNREKG
jgi:hypothetical protein